MRGSIVICALEELVQFLSSEIYVELESFDNVKDIVSDYLNGKEIDGREMRRMFTLSIIPDNRLFFGALYNPTIPSIRAVLSLLKYLSTKKGVISVHWHKGNQVYKFDFSERKMTLAEL